MVGRDNHLSKKMVPLFLLIDSISTFFHRLRHVYKVFTYHRYLMFSCSFHVHFVARLRSIDK